MTVQNLTAKESKKMKTPAKDYDDIDYLHGSARLNNYLHGDKLKKTMHPKDYLCF